MKIKFWSGKEIGLIIKNPVLRKIFTKAKEKNRKSKNNNATTIEQGCEHFSSCDAIANHKKLLDELGCPHRGRGLAQEGTERYENWLAGLSKEDITKIGQSKAEIELAIKRERETKKAIKRSEKECGLKKKEEEGQCKKSDKRNKQEETEAEKIKWLNYIEKGMSFADALREEEKEARNLSLQECRSLEDIESIYTKIDNSWDKYHEVLDLGTKEAYRSREIERIKNNDGEALMKYAKDPIKQTFHEDIQRRYIKYEYVPTIFKSCYKPPASGKNAYYIIDGQVKSGLVIKENEEDRENNKSVDIILEYSFADKSCEFYGYQKYTKDEGGEQNHQFTDAENSAKNFQDMKEPGKFGLCILDGDYYVKRYTKKGKEYSGNRLDYLNEKYGHGKIIACCCDRILDATIPEIINWLKENFSTDESKREIKRLQKIWEIKEL